MRKAAITLLLLTQIAVNTAWAEPNPLPYFPPVLQYDMGFKYYNGDDETEKNLATAVEWFTKAAFAGHRDAQYMLATMLESGEGTAQNESEAFKWYKEAAGQGEVNSQINLSRMYMEGRGTEKDDATGLTWLQKAADAGNRDGQTNLAILYITGYATPQDFEKAMTWAEKAARQQTYDKYFSIAYLYSNPEEDVSPEAAAFEKWLTEKATAGNKQAQFLLGYMHASEQGMPEKYRDAAQWLQKAAEQGDPHAKINLGLLYQQGMVHLESIEEEMAKAHQWYSQAADAGLAQAQYYVGIQFYNGVGTESDPAKAYQWLTLAVENGCEEAKDPLKSIEPDLTPDQITQGKALAQTWKSQHPH